MVRGTPDNVTSGQAWYDDHFVRTSQGWMIRERHCRILWSDNARLEWNPLRIDAAEGKVGFLTMFDKRNAI